MLGYSLFKNLSSKNDLEVYGTVRNKRNFRKEFTKNEFDKIYELDVLKQENLIKKRIAELNPDYVLNCIGSISQKSENEKNVIYLNSALPHEIKKLCDLNSSKLIHFSTDCVFNGKKGNYSEEDRPDATDLYGKTKLLGEIKSKSHITIRTSIIGHELSSKVSLVDWFLNEKEGVKGFKNAIFNGFPSVYIGEILNNYIFKNKNLSGILHVASYPISKYDLLLKISKQYKKEIKIEEYKDFVSNKSLNSKKFNKLTNFSSPDWDYLIFLMFKEYCQNFKNKYARQT